MDRAGNEGCNVARRDKVERVLIAMLAPGTVVAGGRRGRWHVAHGDGGWESERRGGGGGGGGVGGDAVGGRRKYNRGIQTVA